MSVFAARPGDRFLAATILAATGRSEDALAWLEGIGQGSVYDLADLGSALRQRAALLERLGRPDDARREYRHFVALWQNADAEFQPAVDSARSRLAALGGSRP